MNKPGLCCDDCFDLLARKSVAAARLWIHLCDIQNTYNSIFGIKLEDNIYFHLLETMGFITTTDIPDIILCKVHGKQYDELGPFFCAGQCE